MNHFFRKSWSPLVFVFATYAAFAASELQTSKPADPFAYASAPDGKVLPKNVARFRMVHKSISGNYRYDENGKKEDIGATFNAQGMALVFEYGLTERLSFRALAPFMTENKLTLDKEKFARSRLFKQIQEQRKFKLAEELASSKRLCADFNSCLEYIERGRTLPMDRSFRLNNNEYLLFRSNQALKNQIDANIMKAATPAKGAVGMGDMETGLLFNWLGTDIVSISSGIGLRIPTGDYNVPDGARSPAFGAYDVGFQGNLDVSPFAGMWLQGRGKFERALTSVKKEPTSVLDSSKFSSAGNPTPDRTQVEYSKLGWDKVYMLRANYGLGALTTSLKSVALSTSYFNTYSRALSVDGNEQTPEASVQHAGVGATVSGLGYRIPVEVDLSYLEPIAGKNTTMARREFETVLKLFARF